MYKERVNNGPRRIPKDDGLLLGAGKVKTELYSVSEKQKAAGEVSKRFL